jgi:DNA-binding NarL/FixJ family response regulator
MQLIRTLIADDHPIFRKGIKSLLQQSHEPQFEIVGEAPDGKQALDLLRSFQPQLLLLDMNMPIMDGLELLQQLRQYSISVHTLVLSMYDAPRLIRSAIGAGAHGYLLKGQSPYELSQAIQTIFSGETFLGKGVHLHAKPDPGCQQAPHHFFDAFIKKHSLTKRETEILRLITQAMSNKEIGEALFISDQTVGVHRKNIMRKLGVSNTAGLIKTVYDHSLI